VRVLIATWGWRTHFYPMAPLGWALRAAGVDVLVGSHPSMMDTITAAGLPAVPLGADVDFTKAFDGKIVPVRGGRGSGFAGATDPAAVAPEITADGGVARLADALLDDLVAFGREYRPDLIVHEHLNIAAAVAGAALGVPTVRHLWGPDSGTEMILDEQAVIAPRAARHGVATADLTGTLTLDPCPKALQVKLAGPSRPVRFVPYNGPAVLPHWLRRPAPRRRVCVTGGTMMAGNGLDERRGLPDLLAALSGLDAEIVLAVETAEYARLGPLPPNVRATGGPIALHLLLPTCDLLIHQGGAGTLMTGLAAGVPQLVLPRVTDQHFNAWRLTEAGAGARLDDPCDARPLVDALLGEPRWRERARELAREIAAAPSPADLIPELRTVRGVAR
jgi:UDP:flavonoid glycosyltransferase YjiC (YdhE family)